MIHKWNYRKLIYFGLLLIAPEVALANVIIPMLLVTVPTMWLLLGAIVVAEFFVLKKMWPSVISSMIAWRVFFANLVSTLVGVPIAWWLYYQLITIPGILMIKGANKETLEKIPDFLDVILQITIYAPIVWSLDNLKLVYINFLLLIPIAYFLSYWIEYMFFEFEGVDEKEILRGVRFANRASYLLVIIIVSIWFLIMTDSKEG